MSSDRRRSASTSAERSSSIAAMSASLSSSLTAASSACVASEPSTAATSASRLASGDRSATRASTASRIVAGTWTWPRSGLALDDDGVRRGGLGPRNGRPPAHRAGLGVGAKQRRDPSGHDRPGYARAARADRRQTRRGRKQYCSRSPLAQRPDIHPVIAIASVPDAIEAIARAGRPSELLDDALARFRAWVAQAPDRCTQVIARALRGVARAPSARRSVRRSRGTGRHARAVSAGAPRAALRRMAAPRTQTNRGTRPPACRIGAVPRARCRALGAARRGRATRDRGDRPQARAIDARSADAAGGPDR